MREQIRHHTIGRKEIPLLPCGYEQAGGEAGSGPRSSSLTARGPSGPASSHSALLKRKTRTTALFTRTRGGQVSERFLPHLAQS